MSWKFWQRAAEVQTSGVGGFATRSAGWTVPERRDVRGILAAHKDSPWFRSVINRIAESVASTEWEVWVPPTTMIQTRDLGDTGIRVTDQRAYKRALRARTLESRQSATKGWEENPTHPVLGLLERGCPLIPGHVMLGTVQSYIDSVGEAFLAKERNDNGVVESLWPLPPHWVRDVPTQDGGVYRVQVRGESREFAPTDVIWLRHPDLADPYGRGVGQGTSLADELDTFEYASQFTRSFFYNSADTGDVYSLPGATDEQAQAFLAQLDQRHRGAGKGHRPLVTTAELSVEKKTVDLDKLAITPLNEQLQRTIHGAFGVPAEVLGLASPGSTRASFTTAMVAYGRFVVVPRVEFIRSYLQMDLMAEFPDDPGILGYVSPVPADTEFQRTVMQSFPSAFSVGEARKLAGLDPYGDERDTIPLEATPMVATPQNPNAV